MAVDTTTQVTMPAMGESVTEGTVLEWHKQEGDHVEVDDVLVEISTDKVDAEVPSPAAGTLLKIHAPEGETVGVGALLAEIVPNGGAPAATAPAAPAPEPEAPAAPPPAPPPPRAGGPRRGGAGGHPDPRRRRVGHRGHDPRVGRQGRR